MGSHIITIAKNTFRETIRDRVLYGIIGFAVTYTLLTVFLGKLALGDMVMIRSFGLAGVYLFGLIATIFLGSSILHKEIERRTLYFVMPKPVSRFDVVFGKFCGLFAAVSITNVLMAVVYLLVVAYQGGGFDAWGLIAILLQMVEMALFVALLLCLSAAVQPLTATICAVMVLFTGHLLEGAFREAERIGGVAYGVLGLAAHILPNLEKFNIRNFVVHDHALTPLTLLFGAGYGVLYTAFLLSTAYLLFRRREL
jgi:ABC-type transport system involved in multi-copper enzyme maturation permease subunit